MKKLKYFSMAAAATLLGAGLATLYADRNEKAGKGSSVTDFPALLEGKLVKAEADGKFVDFVPEKAPKLYAVYYSAHWCPPCRTFTPELVSFYNENKKGDNFELIFVSSDRSEGAMHEYMAETGMKFPALRFADRKTTEGITKYAGPGIPCLVVLDAKGKVLAHSFAGDKYVGPRVPLQELGKLLAGEAS